MSVYMVVFLKMALTLRILILDVPSPTGLSLVALFNASGSWSLSVLVTLICINLLSIRQLFHLTQFFKNYFQKNVSQIFSVSHQVALIRRSKMQNKIVKETQPVTSSHRHFILKYWIIVWCHLLTSTCVCARRAVS